MFSIYLIIASKGCNVKLILFDQRWLMIAANQKSLSIKHGYIRLHSSHALWCVAAFIFPEKSRYK